MKNQQTNQEKSAFKKKLKNLLVKAMQEEKDLEEK